MLLSIDLINQKVHIEKKKFGEGWFDLDMLRRTNTVEVSTRFVTATNRVKSENLDKGKKELFHCIRYKVFAIEFCKEKKVEDLSCANYYYYDILKDSQLTISHWTERVNHYKEIIHNLSFPDPFRKPYSLHCRKETRYLSVRKSLEKRLELERRGTRDPIKITRLDKVVKREHEENEPLVCKWLRENGNSLKEMESKLELNYSYHGKFEDLVIIFHSRLLRTTRSIELQCGNGIVLNARDDWKVVCFPLESFGHFNEHDCKQFLPSSLT